MARSFWLTSVTILIGICTFKETTAFTCYACSYLFSGTDGSSGIKCVTDPANYTLTTTLPCDGAGMKCTIQTVYEQGTPTEKGRLLSLDRRCRVPEKDKGCYELDGIRPTCFYDCETDLCNDINGDLMPDDTGSGHIVTSSIVSLTLCTLLIVLTVDQ